MEIAVHVFFLLVIVLFALTIIVSRRVARPFNPAITFFGGIATYIAYETTAQKLYPEFNIRADLFIIYALFIFSAGSLLSAPGKKSDPTPNVNAKSDPRTPILANLVSSPSGVNQPIESQNETDELTSKRATRCLYLALIGIPLYGFFVLSISSVAIGHLALRGHPTKCNRVKLLIGMTIGYATLALGAASWAGYVNL